MAGLDKDNRLETYFPHDGSQKNACIDTVGLTCIIDLLEETYMLNVGALGGGRGAGDGCITDTTLKRVIPNGLDLLDHMIGILLVAGYLGDKPLLHNIRKDAVGIRMLLVDVAGKEPAEIMQVVVGIENAEKAIVDGTIVETDVFNVDLFIVDIAGKSEVGSALLPQLVEFVVLPLN